ncbi:MAG: PQQ-binding-like beta-propeller repeat protein [Planctomycetes bacterium]|nr:PQQ-binding-like beta-propeller repeat protein [Planctomycetota bacterium]
MWPNRLKGLRTEVTRKGRHLVKVGLSVCLTVWLGAAVASEIAAAADWPTYRADAARSGYTAEALPNRLRLRWAFRCPHPPRPAWPTLRRIEFDWTYQPIVVGDAVLFGTSTNDCLYAVDADTGRVRWQFHADGPIRFAPAAWRDRVFLASDDGWLYALRLADGKLLWKHRGGPTDAWVLGNERLVSHWPARGGPVVFQNTVYYAAGLWPSDGVYLHSLDAETGKVLWTNGDAGSIVMPQPHGGAEAASGVSPQGYLLATDDWLLVPNGRAVPAAFHRKDGTFAYFHLQKNGQRGGTRALIADRYFFNAGCLFELTTGELAARQGLGVLAATHDGLLQAAGRALTWFRWTNAEKRDRKGRRVTYRRLVEHRLIEHDRDIFELIVAGEDAICGEDGRVSAVDFTRQRSVWWSHPVEGIVRGLAAGNGRLVVSTDRGVVYCFDGTPPEPIASGRHDNDRPTQSVPSPALTGPPQSKTSGTTVGSADEIDFARAAERILAKTGVTEGYCVDLGAGEGKLALELAKRSKLQVYAVEADPQKAAAARARLEAAGLYGVRVTVHCADPARVSYPDYFANLVVSSQSLNRPLPPAVLRQMRRMQRPYGGKLCRGPVDELIVETRGPLNGAGSWTHQNANPANTVCSMDGLVQGRLRMFWFRDVDFEIPNRHGQGPAPQAHRGYLIVGGVHGLCALDAYNGRALWTFEIPNLLRDYDGIHHDVGVGDTGGVFCLSDDSVYVKTDDRCLRIDLATGRLVREFRTPVAADAQNRSWGYLAFDEGLLFGTVANDQHTVSPRYKLIRLRTESVLFFAMDAQTGQVIWQYQPQHSIRNNAIAIGGGRVYLSADRAGRPYRPAASGWPAESTAEAGAASQRYAISLRRKNGPSTLAADG